MPTTRVLATVLLSASLFVISCASPPKATSPETGPTEFITSNLILPAMEESPGDVTIGVTVTNTGATEGTHELKLVIDGKVVATKQVVLAGGASQNVSFSTVLNHPGINTVQIGQVTGKLDWPGPN